MKISHVAIALAIIGTLSACTPTGRVVDGGGQAQRVCAVLPLSGDYALIGQEIARGMQLASAEQNVTLLLEDDQYEKRNTASATQKLVDEGCKTVIIADAATGAAAAPILAASHAQGIILQDRTDYIDRQEHLRSIGFKTEAVGALMADYALAHGAKKAVVLRDENEWSLTISDSFARRFEERGGSVESITLAPSEDFATLVTKVKALEPDAVYFPIVTSPATFVKRAREQQLHALMLSGDGFTDDQVAAAGAAAEGVCKTDVPSMMTGRMRSLETAYNATYGAEPSVPIFVGMGFDALSAAAIAQKTGDMDLTLDSVLGDKIMLARDAPPRLERIYCIKDGKKELAD